MQMNRLFGIVYFLLAKKSATAKELAERFEVSTRTIYRDIEILSGANIPIYTNQGKSGGICLLENFVLENSFFSEEEQNHILFALQGMNTLSRQDERSILEKLTILFHKNQTNWIDVDLSSWENVAGQDERFQVIKEAILKQRVLQFVYYNASGEEKERRAEPLQIYFKDKAWYLKAFAQDKQAYRLFKISRMKKIEMQEENFERELPETIEKKTDFKTIKLELEIAKEMAYRVYDEFEKETITKKENGDFLINIEYPENDWVYGYILSFGEYAKVLAPKYAKEIVKQRVKKMAKKYFKYDISLSYLK